MDNKSFTIKCNNCNYEATLKDGVDTFYTDIEIVTYSDFSMNIKCKKCSSLIKAKC